jgi:hypothetical protein
MIVDSGVHGANHAKIVSNSPQRRCGLAEVHPAFAIASKSPRAPKQSTAGLPGVVILDRTGVRLHVQPVELRFGVEQINMAGPTLHKHGNHRRRHGPLCSRLGLQIPNHRLQRRLRRLPSPQPPLHPSRSNPRQPKHLLLHPMPSNKMRHHTSPIQRPRINTKLNSFV